MSAARRLPTSFDDYLGEVAKPGLPCEYRGEHFALPRQLPALTQLLFARAREEDRSGLVDSAEIDAAVVPLVGRKRLKRWRRAWDAESVPEDLQDEHLAAFLGYALARYNEALYDSVEQLLESVGGDGPGEALAPAEGAPLLPTSSTSGN